MNWLETVRMALCALMRHKLRSLLTMLGMIVGVGGVIAIVSIGESAQALAQGCMKHFGLRSAIARPYCSKDDERFESMRQRDAYVIATTPGVIEVAPVAGGPRGVLRWLEKHDWAYTTGVTRAFFEIQATELLEGRLINDDDVTNLRRVVVLSETTRERLFGEHSPIGERVRLDETTLTVIGVTKNSQAEALGMGPKRSSLYCPLSWAQHATGQHGLLSHVFFTYQSDMDLYRLATDIPAKLRAAHRMRGNFAVDFFTEAVAAVDKVGTIITLAISAIASIALLVGGIGIMNIMLVSVAERTSEIGLRKALGAKKGDILRQFLVESATVSGLGGILGIACGAGLAAIGLKLIEWRVDIPAPLTLSATAIAIALSISIGLGLFFGSWPAYKASRMDPITALRHL